MGLRRGNQGGRVTTSMRHLQGAELGGGVAGFSGGADKARAMQEEGNDR
jgi:hypothetical protein